MTKFQLTQVMGKMGQQRDSGRGKVSNTFIYDLHVIQDLWDNREAVLERRVEFRS